MNYQQPFAILMLGDPGSVREPRLQYIFESIEDACAFLTSWKKGVQEITTPKGNKFSVIFFDRREKTVEFAVLSGHENFREAPPGSLSLLKV